jgi:hypothetical protein
MINLVNMIIHRDAVLFKFEEGLVIDPTKGSEILIRSQPFLKSLILPGIPGSGKKLPRNAV